MERLCLKCGAKAEYQLGFQILGSEKEVELRYTCFDCYDDVQNFFSADFNGTVYTHPEKPKKERYFIAFYDVTNLDNGQTRTSHFSFAFNSYFNPVVANDNIKMLYSKNNIFNLSHVLKNLIELNKEDYDQFNLNQCIVL